jgi:hypothetical protein
MDTITQAYLNSIWIQWAHTVVRRFADVYHLDEESYELYVELFLKANDWVLIVGEPLA